VNDAPCLLSLLATNKGLPTVLRPVNLSPPPLPGLSYFLPMPILKFPAQGCTHATLHQIDFEGQKNHEGQNIFECPLSINNGRVWSTGLPNPHGSRCHTFHVKSGSLFQKCRIIIYIEISCHSFSNFIRRLNGCIHSWSRVRFIEGVDRRNGHWPSGRQFY